MSHATGEVVKGAVNKYYFLYDGYNVMPKLFTSSNLAWSQWGQNHEDAYKIPPCKHPKTTVELFVNYGAGLRWCSGLCETCKLITRQRDPYRY